MIFKKILVNLLKNRQKNANISEIKQKIKNTKSILLRPLGSGAIGDAVVHTAHLLQIRKIYPQAKLGVIVSNTNKLIFKRSNLCDELIEESIFSYIKNSNKWDIMLDFGGNFTSYSIMQTHLLNPKIVIIFNKLNKKFYNLKNINDYDINANIPLGTPLSHYLNHSILGEIFNLPSPQSTLLIDKKLITKVTNFWQKDSIKILLCPQGSKREIPASEISNLLNQTCNTKNEWKVSQNVCFLLSNTTGSEVYFSKILTHNKNLKLAPKVNLDEFLSLVDSADIVIAVDGAALHIACALKKPLLSFFADNYPNKGTWKPLIAKNIPSLCILTSDKKENSNDTSNFDMQNAARWLSAEILKFTNYAQDYNDDK
ncbi:MULTISPECIES: glycosyltransferase family 9 protein [unclassified Campylobacter]|uniref:glycosyltransferase family 9 protein n=1 Tax=unclassified Campylobacter TaxID=2593542 RepID=UPI003D329556